MDKHRQEMKASFQFFYRVAGAYLAMAGFVMYAMSRDPTAPPAGFVVMGGCMAFMVVFMALMRGVERSLVKAPRKGGPRS